MAWTQKKSGRYYAYFKDQERTPVAKSVPLRVIQELAGHSTIAMTQQYSHLQPGILGAAIDQTFGSVQPDPGDSEDREDEAGAGT